MAEGTSRNPERDARWRRWMVAAQQGDRESYQKLLEELAPYLRVVVRDRVGDRADVEDVVQDVLLSIHTARHTYRPERPLAPWVRTIARNASIDWGRRATRQLKRYSDTEVETVPERESMDAPEILAHRLSPGLTRALEQLPDAQREAVTLLKVEGLTVAEAAERVGVSSGALKLRAHRGYQSLRDLLGRSRL